MSEIIYFHIYYQIKTHFSTNETLTVYYTQICVFTQQKYAFSITHWKEIKCFDTAQEEPRQSVHLCPGKGLSQSEEWHPEWQPETLLHSEHPYLAALASGALWERFASPSLLQSKGVLPSNSPLCKYTYFPIFNRISINDTFSMGAFSYVISIYSLLHCEVECSSLSTHYCQKGLIRKQRHFTINIDFWYIISSLKILVKLGTIK